MSKTFEELAGSELDTLYQGALFLSGGDARAAERLLIESITLAFEEHAGDTDERETRRWFEARLVRSFLRHVRGEPRPTAAAPLNRDGIDPNAFQSLGSDELFGAAAEIPAWPRAALWLVLLRRWSYEDAAAAMNIDERWMYTLLGYRDALMRELLGSTRPGRKKREVS